MLVLRGDRQGIPETELKVLDWLRASDLAGVVVSGAAVQSRNRRRRGSRRWSGNSVEADLIVITPQVCLVIEVKGIKKPVSGVLSCPVNGRWTMPGVDMPVNVRGGDTNPIDQAKEAMFGFKGLVDKASPGPGTFVLALVVVMPMPGHTVTLNPGEIGMPPGCEILLAPHRDALHHWFAPEPRGAKRALHRARAYRPEAPWTAERVMQVLNALLNTHDATINDLTKHGFLTDQSIASGPPTSSTEAAPHDSALPPLFSPVEPSSGPPTSSPHLQVVPEAALDNEPTTVPHPDAAVRPPASSVEEDPASSTHPVRTLVLAAAALVAVGTGLWGFAGCSSTSSQHDAPAPVETSNIAPTPAPAPAPAPAALDPPPAPLDEEPLPETPPPPQQPAGCFPFQSNC